MYRMAPVFDYFRRNRREIVRYLIAWWSNTAFGLVLSNALYYVIWLSTRLTVTITFVVTQATLFLLSKNFTFRAEWKTRKQFTGFAVLMISNYLVSLWFIPFCQESGASFFVSQLLFLTGFMIINFLVKRHLIFKLP